MLVKLIGRFIILILVTLALLAPSQEVSAQSFFPSSMGIEQAPQPADIPIEQWIAEHAARLFVFLPQVLLNVEHENLDPRLPADCYGWLEGYHPEGEDVVTDFFLCDNPQTMVVYEGMTVTVHTWNRRPLQLQLTVPEIGLSQTNCWGHGRVLTLETDILEFPASEFLIKTDGSMCGYWP